MGNTVDMGYEVFERNPQLRNTLAYAVVSGLAARAEMRLLCDFSAGGK